MDPKSLFGNEKRQRSANSFQHEGREKESSTHPLTLVQVVFNASLLYRSNSAMVPSIFLLSFVTVAIIFLRAASFFSTLRRKRAEVSENSNLEGQERKERKR